MKILVLSDCHGNVQILDRLDGEFQSADAVLFAGDFADCIKNIPGLPVLDALCKKHDSVFAVLGNNDEPDFIEALEESGANIERALTFWNDLYLIGSGGGTVFTHETPNERTEDEIMSDYAVLDADSDCGIWPQLVVVSHNPPKDTACDAVNATLHAGSAKFRRFIEEKKPLAVATGHIHEGAGIDRIGGTTVINPGAAALGSYAVLELERQGGMWQVSSAELRHV